MGDLVNVPPICFSLISSESSEGNQWMINIPGGSMDSANLIVWDEDGQPTPNELWWFLKPNDLANALSFNSGLDPKDSSVFIVSNLTGMVMDLTGDSTAEGNNIQTYPMNWPPSTNQRWLWVETGGEGTGVIASAFSQGEDWYVANAAGAGPPTENPVTPVIIWPAPWDGNQGSIAATPNEIWYQSFPAAGPYMQWFIAAFQAWDNTEPQPGVKFAAANDDNGNPTGQIINSYECSGNSPLYVVTTTPGTVLELDPTQGWTLRDSTGYGYAPSTFTNSPATIYVLDVT